MVARALRKLGLQPPRRWLTKMMQVLTTRIELLVMVAENRLGMEIQTVKEVAACVLCLGHLQQPLPDPQPVFEVQHSLYKWDNLRSNRSLSLTEIVMYRESIRMEVAIFVAKTVLLGARFHLQNYPHSEDCTEIHWQIMSVWSCQHHISVTTYSTWLLSFFWVCPCTSDACCQDDSCTQAQSCRIISYMIFASIWCHWVNIFGLLCIPISIASYTALHRIWCIGCFWYQAMYCILQY